MSDLRDTVPTLPAGLVLTVRWALGLDGPERNYREVETALIKFLCSGALSELRPYVPDDTENE
jgi:hypothetical protein